MLWAAAATVCSACSRIDSDTSRGELRPAPQGTTAVASPEMTPDDGAEIGSRFRGRVPRQWGTHLPGVETAVPAGHEYPTMSLTFDACGGANGSLVDVALLDTLRRESIPATLFLNERWVRDNRQLTRVLASDPLFQIGNHGTRHVPLSVNGRAVDGVTGTTNAHEVVKEILHNQHTLVDLTGTQPQWFRSGTGYYDDVAIEIAAQLGFGLAGWTVDADSGATTTPHQIADAMVDAPDGAIVRLRMDHPFGGTGAGLKTAIPRLRERGAYFTHLPQPSFP